MRYHLRTSLRSRLIVAPSTQRSQNQQHALVIVQIKKVTGSLTHFRKMSILLLVVVLVLLFSRCIEAPRRLLMLSTPNAVLLPPLPAHWSRRHCKATMPCEHCYEALRQHGPKGATAPKLAAAKVTCCLVACVSQLATASAQS